MQMQYLLAIWAIVAFILYRIITSIITERRYAAEATRLGCEPAPTISNRLPWGIEHIMQALRADKSKKFPEWVQQRYKSMGDRTFQHFILGNQAFTTNDPKNVQAILATQFKDFGLGERRQGTFKPLLGFGIFTTDGKVWEHSRAMMRPQFNRDQVSDLELEEQHVQNLMRALPTTSITSSNAPTSGRWTGPVDLQVLFFRLTLDSACEFLFGESVDSQILNLPENTRQQVQIQQQNPSTSIATTTDEKTFAGAFDRGQAWLSRRSRFMNLYWLVDGLQERRDTKAVHDFVDHFVQLALKHQASVSGGGGAKASSSDPSLEKGPASQPYTPRRNSSGKEKYVFLEILAAQTQDPLELRSQLLNILLAGRDTTASLLGWTFWLLARHPAVFNKLRAAVIETFGPYNSSSSSSSTSSITYTSLKSCTYLQHVLNESLRLHPVVPVNMRQALRDTTLPRGGGADGSKPVQIRKGQCVDYSVHVMHRLEGLWGADAAEFRPERWVGRKPGWEYLPFNGGPRICLGREYIPFSAPQSLTMSLAPGHVFTMLDWMDRDLVVRCLFDGTIC